MARLYAVLWTFLAALAAGLLAACSSTAVQQSESAAPQMETDAADAQASASGLAKAAAAPAPSLNSSISSRERLGTKWGDEISSHVTEVDLKRLSAAPLSEVQVRYAGKQFSGRSISSISLASGKVSFSVTDDRGRALPLYRDGQNYYLSANDGQSYQLKYSNSSAQTFEIVASVDGLDVLNGQKASRYSSGYVLRPYSSFAIEGFRKSSSSVASFTFSKPKDSYAANSAHGSIQNTGVIGTAVYELNAPRAAKQPEGKYAPAPNAFPADRN